MLEFYFSFLCHSVERLYNQLWESTQPALEPLIITSAGGDFILHVFLFLFVQASSLSTSLFLLWLCYVVLFAIVFGICLEEGLRQPFCGMAAHNYVGCLCNLYVCQANAVIYIFSAYTE